MEYKKIKHRTPNLSYLLNKFIKDKIEVPQIKNSLAFVKNANSQFKKDISSLHVIDLTNDKLAKNDISRYYQN